MLIHIGYPKTGTTWLQGSLFPAHPDVDYWHFGDPAHAWIEQIVHLHDDEFDAANFRAKNVPRMGPSARPVVISWESLSGDVWAGAWDSRRNARRLRELFPAAKVVITVRNQLPMLESLYRQYVQEGGALSLKSFLALCYPSRVHFRLEHLCYERLIDHYVSLFGQDQVRVYLYEELARDAQAIMNDLSDWCGWQRAEIPRAALSRQSNKSLSYLSTAFARFFNRFVYSHLNVSPLLPAKLMDARYVKNFFRLVMDPLGFRRLMTRGEFVDADLKLVLGGLYGPGNRKLLEAYGLPVDRYGYPL